MTARNSPIQRELERSRKLAQALNSAQALHDRSNTLLSEAAQYKSASNESILFVETADILRDCARIYRLLADEVS